MNSNIFYRTTVMVRQQQEENVAKRLIELST